MRFRAPEVLQGKPYTFTADCFSLGVILYFMCTQKLPFNSEQEVLKKDVDYKLLREKGYSAQCIDLIAKLLVRNPSFRYKAEKALTHSWMCEQVEPVKKKKTAGRERGASLYMSARQIEAAKKAAEAPREKKARKTMIVKNLKTTAIIN